MAKGTLPKPTRQQARFITLFKENVLKNGNKSIKELMRLAGYSEESVRQHSNTMDALRPHLDPFVTKMEAQREKAIARMEATVDSASYSDATRAVGILTENIRLLSGKSTQNVAVIAAERRGEIDRMLDE